MTRARVFDTASFTAYFVLAALLGRQAVLDGTSLALIWPAAGVAVAWLAVDGWTRWGVLDLAIVFTASVLVNDLTGTSTPLSLGLGAATVVQVVVFGLLISRWCPTWWGFGTEPPPGVEAMRDLGYLIGAAFLATLASALLGPAAVLSIADADWTSIASWVLRNATGIVAIFPLSLLARHAARAHNPTSAPTAVGPLRALGPVELVALVAATVVMGWLVFGVEHSLPLPFLLLATSVWAGGRFSPGIADAHAILLSTWVVVATVVGNGPFDSVADPHTRALVVQAYVAVVVALTLTLSVVRREALLLADRLVASEKAATEQAVLMRTILDTMADGVSAIDVHGSVVLRNPAAAQMMGASRFDDRGVVDVDAYGITHADGSPLRAEESPMALALGGEDVDGLELLVRNPASPDGRLLEVTARTLPDIEPGVAVVVFHDVTADRRERDELASFAGVVAHDLLNPLTIIDGWSDALLEEERDPMGMDPAQRVQHLERIQRAALRMRALISDLLAYTTARDSTIHPVRVDVEALVRDVARTRVEAARVSDGPVPDIRVEGPLPPVLAEPVLIRQVVDNLIGNAVKYVAPGTAPVVRVCAREALGQDDAALVEIRVIDNGIGIPDGQHARVFDTFHRAHLDGYRGTGLGLSIVKRIVERHGGSASAADNPSGGGTTMSVSFPAASVVSGPDGLSQEQ